MSRPVRLAAASIASLLALLVAGGPLAARHEGMWTFDNLPLKILEERYGFKPTTDWLDHIRLSSGSLQ